MNTADLAAPLPLPEELLQQLQAQYAQPPRAYHNFAHVQEVLGHYAAVAADVGWAPTVSLRFPSWWISRAFISTPPGRVISS